MKLIYNVVDVIFEYTAICLANVSMKITQYNLPLAVITSILLGGFFVIDFAALLLAGWNALCIVFRFCRTSILKLSSWVLHFKSDL